MEAWPSLLQDATMTLKRTPGFEERLVSNESWPDLSDTFYHNQRGSQK